MTINGTEHPEEDSRLSIWMDATSPGRIPRLFFSLQGQQGMFRLAGHEVKIAPAIHFSAPFNCQDWRCLSGLSYDERSPGVDMSAWVTQPQYADVNRFRFTISGRTGRRFSIECSVHVTIYGLSGGGRKIHLRTLTLTDFDGVDVGLVGSADDAVTMADTMLSPPLNLSTLLRPVVRPRLDPSGHKVLACEVHYEPTPDNN